MCTILPALLLCCTLGVQAKVYKVDDVPLVHLQDRTRYVSNPDGVLSAAAVATIDSIFFSLEQSTGIRYLWLLLAILKAVTVLNLPML